MLIVPRPGDQYRAVFRGFADHVCCHWYLVVCIVAHVSCYPSDVHWYSHLLFLVGVPLQGLALISGRIYSDNTSTRTSRTLNHGRMRLLIVGMYALAVLSAVQFLVLAPGVSVGALVQFVFSSVVRVLVVPAVLVLTLVDSRNWGNTRTRTYSMWPPVSVYALPSLA